MRRRNAKITVILAIFLLTAADRKFFNQLTLLIYIDKCMLITLIIVCECDKVVFDRCSPKK